MVVPPERGHHERRQSPDGRAKELKQVDVSPRLSARTIDRGGSCQTLGHVDRDKNDKARNEKESVKLSKGGLLGDGEKWVDTRLLL